MLFELDPAPEGVLLPGLEFPPLPASPPEPGRAVPLVFAPLVPAGSDDLSVPEELLSEVELFMLLPFDVPLDPDSLVAAISGIDSTQVNPAIANA